ncbi:unnamed protein product [Urochloa decumbens]|uniref:DUF4220 domain-containing protein n=1 Tax=Urochloa decumbens TaxID=240449 RepID=A0ABC8W6G1_9POAL
MAGIWRAVLWWDEWQLRILVLGSLGFQWFLLLAAPMRNYTIPRWFRTCIWLAYITADALAIYALATLFNRHARANSHCDQAAKETSLEVLWAPLLLIYLGGREEITAYNIEDNELWTRHTVTLVSQVTVALYAFYKSWTGTNDDRKLLLSAILLFVVGIISFCEKPWSLRRASINRLVAMSSLMKGERKSPSGWQWCFTELDDRYKCWKARRQGNAPILSQGDKVQMMLSDLSLYAAKVTLEIRKKGTDQEILEPLILGEDKMKPWLRQAFGLIYTRANVLFTPAYLACHVLLVPSLYIAAIMLFATSHKHGYYRTDVKITYILLCFTSVLDVFGLLLSETMYWLMSSKARVPALCENLPGYNLVDSVLRTMRPRTGPLLKLVKRMGYKEGYFRQPKESLYGSVSDFITAELVSVARRVENADFSTFRSFSRGYWNLRPVLRDVCRTRTEIQRSLRRSPFDASVLLWHIATDLCFRCKPPENFSQRPLQGEVVRDVCTEAISNYMAYLLNFQPEMLMTGTRQHLFTEATKHMERILAKVDEGGTFKHKLQDNKQQEQKLDDAKLGKITDEAAKLVNDPNSRYRYTVVHDACKLAEELMGIDEETRWHLMYRVWVGMLCYSASMCRGYLHAKSLGEGGEFLSYVWLIISLTGSKTLADKLQMPEPEAEELETRTDPTNAAQEGRPAASSRTFETEDGRLDRIFV